MLRPCIYAVANIIINNYLRIDGNVLMNGATTQKTYRVLENGATWREKMEVR